MYVEVTYMYVGSTYELQTSNSIAKIILNYVLFQQSHQAMAILKTSFLPNLDFYCVRKPYWEPVWQTIVLDIMLLLAQ